MATAHPFNISRSEGVSEGNFQKVLESKKFQEYTEILSKASDIEAKNIEILSTFMFGPKVGFVTLNVDAILKGANTKLPGYVFLRGAAVAILVIINKTKMLLTRQFRVPKAGWMLEAPAGMLDEDGNFMGVAAKELKEETGIEIKESELISLGSIYVSPGGSDEIIQLFALEKEISEEKLTELTSKIYGEKDEHEHITLEIQDFKDEIVLQTQDVKLISAAFAYKSKNK